MNHIETVLAHAGCLPDPATGALIPPIQLSTTFVHDPDSTSEAPFHYARENNPNRQSLEKTLATIEGGSDCAAFSSGMAAATAIVSSLGPNAHVIYPDDVYVGVRRLFEELTPEWGVSTTSVNMQSPVAIVNAIRKNTRLVWIETPSNPLVRVTDIAACVEEAHRRGTAVVVDSTWTTPLLQRPLDLGADLVLHSVTKYLAGHSDVVGGAVISKERSPLFDMIRKYQTHAGPVMDPFSAWLTMRGLRTLAVRMSRQCDTAEKVAHFLQDHKSIRVVHFPGLPEHPGFAVASRQMSRYGAMISFEVAGDRSFAVDVVRRTRVFARATSLGGTESLIEHRASSEGAGSATPQTLIRLSIGLEAADDLTSDLDAALSS